MLKKLFDLKSPLLLKWFLLFSAIIHIIAVCFSEGFHRPDEHLGMLRYVFVKLGQYPIDELSWEYPAKIRNWVQPGLYYFLLKPFYILGLTDPFKLTFILRLATSLFSFFVLFRFYLFSKIFLNTKASHNLSIILFFGLWFFPFIHARTTAENFGMNVFALAFISIFKHIEKSTLTVKNPKTSLTKFRDNLPIRSSILGGFLLGMSVNFRIPLAPMPLFLILWLILFTKTSIKSLVTISAGVLLSILLTIGFDSWGYGELTYSTWNYLYQEFTNNVSNGFGTSPWYYYFEKTFAKGVPPLSFFIIFSFLYLWIRSPKHILTWCTLPVFFLHCMIGHKELRYIFPLIIFIPIICSVVFEKFQKDLDRRFFKILISITLITNLFFLIISSLKPAYTPIGIYKFLNKNKDNISTLYTYNNYQRDILKIYIQKDISFQLTEGKEKVREIISKEAESWFLVEKIKDFELFEEKNCKSMYSSYPIWFTNNFKNFLSRSKSWSIFKCLPQ